MNKTTANLGKLSDFIFQHGLSEDDIIVASASQWESKLHLTASAFDRVTKPEDCRNKMILGLNIHKHANMNGVAIICVERLEPVQVTS